MNPITLKTDVLNNLPWQARPTDCTAPLWRYQETPIIRRNPIPGVARIFNSAVLPYEGAYIGVFRGEQTNGIPFIYLGRSKDGIHWEFEPEKIAFVDEAGNPFMPKYAYDPRLVKVEDTYYIIWCQDAYGAAIGMAKTTDFKTFTRLENPFIPYNRNAVLFPRKINGNYMLLSRPSDSGHTPFGDIYISYSPDMKYWGEHRCVMKVTPFPESAWQCTKIGAGSVPFLTEEGWLIFYHGVITTCNGFRYSMGAAILDKENPAKVLYRTRPYLLAPAAPYELQGDVPNVVFPCASLQDGDKVAVYYGAADTVVGMAFGYISEIIEFTKKNSIV